MPVIPDTLLNLFVPLLLAGAFAGIVAGLLGVGGGIVIVPVMTVVLTFLAVPPAVSMHIAVASSLAVIIATAIVSSRAHGRRGALDMAIVRRWGPFIALGALAGALVARLLSGDFLRLLFATLALIVGLRFLLARQHNAGRLNIGSHGQRVCAAVIGLLSSWLGIGGGTFSVPLLHAQGLAVHRAVGTSALIGLFIALPATVGYIASGIGVPGRPGGSLGYLYLPAVLVLALSATVLTPLGARLAHRLPQHRLRQVFGVFLLLASARLFERALG